MTQSLRQRWHELLDTWTVGPAQADRAFADLCAHYAEPGRCYHTLDHVRGVLDTVEALAPHAHRPDAVRLASWLHDVIYDSRAADNEERSAVYAEQRCAECAIPEAERVAELIRRTQSHDAGDDVDARVLLDADLAILGADAADYRRYAEQIRQEYAWVPEPDYRAGRRRVLQRFLARPRIFHLLTDREEAARHNLAAECARLAPE